MSKEDIGSQIKSIFLDQIAASKDLTCKRPTDKNAKSFSLDIDFVLAPSGTEFKGQMNLAMSYWPKKTIFGRAANGGSASNAREIPSLVEGISEAILAKVLPQLKTQIPKLADV